MAGRGGRRRRRGDRRRVPPLTGVEWRPPLAVAATATYRTDPKENQDAFRVLDAERDGCTAVVVADGRIVEVGDMVWQGQLNALSRHILKNLADILGAGLVTGEPAQPEAREQGGARRDDLGRSPRRAGG